MAVYFRNDPMNFGPRQHPVISPAELVSMAKIGEWDTSKKTNGFNKEDKVACEWAFLSAMLTLQAFDHLLSRK